MSSEQDFKASMGAFAETAGSIMRELHEEIDSLRGQRLMLIRRLGGVNTSEVNFLQRVDHLRAIESCLYRLVESVGHRATEVALQSPDDAHDLTDILRECEYALAANN